MGEGKGTWEVIDHQNVKLNFGGKGGEHLLECSHGG